MKVLFALGNEQTSKKVAEKYYEKYGEELEYKNVFYFKALLDEVKSNKTYDRIVVSEELEQFHVKNLEALDRFIFKNVDNITDEIEDSEVIFICSDRRSKQNDRFVEKLFNIGVYNTLIGDERRIEPLCDYIKKPMNKKEAKRHLNITSVVSEGEIASSDDTVEEVQIMNILKYYDGIKGKREEYLKAFDKISEQYSRNQLKVIMNFLPNDVKTEILSSAKYQFLAEGMPASSIKPNKTLSNRPARKGLFDILKQNKNKETIKKQPDVIVEEQSGDKVENLDSEKESRERKQTELKANAEQELREREQAELRAKAEQEAREREQAELRAKAEQEAREREQTELKAKAEQEAREREQAELRAKAEQEAREREQAELRAKAEQETREREQAKLKAKAEQQNIKNNNSLSEVHVDVMPPVGLNVKSSDIPQKMENVVPTQAISKQTIEQERLEAERRKLEQEKLALEEEKRKLREQSEQLSRNTEAIARSDFNKEMNDVRKIDYKKMVIFVGANKSGTTFMVNAVAHNLADNKVSVGVLDMTRDKSLYYIYNQDDRELRQIATECMQKLSQGVDSYIPAEKNLKIYTTVPGPSADSRRIFKNRAIIDTVREFNNVVIVDADFSTSLEYYEKADEIYIVQDLDIMKMQETTLFLRELKNRSINMGKIKVIINKYVKSLLTPKKLIQGLSYYNDPQMSFTDELLESKVLSFVVPFNVENYSRYIDGMYKNSLDYKKYTLDFLSAVAEVSESVFRRSDTTPKRRGFFG